MQILRNCWYTIGWADRLEQEPEFEITVADERIVVVASGADRITAKASGPDGQPRTVALKDGIIWLWLGTQDADYDAIPDFSSIYGGHNETTLFKGYLPTEANYELLSDNIMDLSHTDFLHPHSLGGMMAGSVMSIDRDGDAITVVWDSPNGPALPMLKHNLPEPDAPAHVRIGVRWTPPSNMLLWVDFAPAGEPLEKWFKVYSPHLMTPESEFKTHYFFAGNRNWKTDDLAVTAHIEHAVTQAFATEDKPIIEAQQRQMGVDDFWELKPALLPIDKAGILARRTLSKLIKTEAALAA